MKLIVGLGNPGRRYGGTRHNVGFDVLDTIAGRNRLEWESAPRGIESLVTVHRDLGQRLVLDALDSDGLGAPGASPVASAFRRKDMLLAKPMTFMNLSGQAVGDLLRFYKIGLEDLLVIVDDTNLEVGRLRARVSGSAGGHNGLKSLIGLLGSEQFARLRVGVGRGDARRDLADHVLATFDPQERAIVAEAVGRAADAADLFVAEGIGPVMNRYNRKEDAE